jgi:hypothetical protein
MVRIAIRSLDTDPTVHLVSRVPISGEFITLSDEPLDYCVSGCFRVSTVVHRADCKDIVAIVNVDKV